MKYYYREHLSGYEKVEREGKSSWGEIHGHPDDFERFSSRPFLEQVLPQLEFDSERPLAFELGCGTGPGACFLAGRGFQVDAIDLIPAAIDIARRIATERNLDIHYEVMDVTEIPLSGARYDLIVDSYCLQGIVMDEDRRSVFAAVHARLKPSGYYLISTAVYEEARRHPDDVVVEPVSANVYHRYDEHSLFDPTTDILYEPFSGTEYDYGLDDAPEDYEGSTQIAGRWYLPKRRYRTAKGLRAELEDEGFKTLLQTGEFGENVLCTLAADSTSNRMNLG